MKWTAIHQLHELVLFEILTSRNFHVGAMQFEFLSYIALLIQ